MDRNANRIANENFEEGADARSRLGGGPIRRGRREARARNKAARRADARWNFRNSLRTAMKTLSGHEIERALRRYARQHYGKWATIQSIEAQLIECAKIRAREVAT
jgi:hypothetical protein